MNGSSGTRLVVRADDAGSSWSSNVGCLRAATEGIVRSVEVMMPGAWVGHAADAFNRRPEIDVGIHLTLASEWDAVRWRPLTAAPSLVDESGHFPALLLPRDGDPRRALAEVRWSRDEIRRELHEQVVRGIATFRHVSHVSTHMARHLADLDPEVGAMVGALCREFDLLDDPMGSTLPRVAGYPHRPFDAAARTDALVATLGSLGEDTWLFVDHPAAASEELRATGHVGYEDVLEDRASCLAALTDERVRRAVRDNGIELIGYRDLANVSDGGNVGV